MTSRIDIALDRARARLRRLSPEEVPGALARGAILVDIRPAAQRAAEGEIGVGLVVERNVLEWRCDPTSDSRLPEAIDDHVEWVVVCSQGYTSSLAAAALRDLGLHRATDVVGGYQAMARAGALAAPAAAAKAPPAALMAVALATGALARPRTPATLRRNGETLCGAGYPVGQDSP